MSVIDRSRRRRRSLGAAMIEASVVMLTIVVTWGAMATAYTNGSAKLAAQWQARSATMYFASNECKKAIPAGGSASKSTSGAIDQRSGDAEGDRAQAGAPLGQSQSARQTMFMASGSGTGASTMGRWSAQKSSSSWAICNEGKYDGDLLGLLAYGADFFHDLLPGPIQAIFLCSDSPSTSGCGGARSRTIRGRASASAG
jgi:hypothetical protein